MADLELESLGNGDGNNYLLRDNTKIPLSGSNQISGDLIPATDNSYNLGDSSHNFKIVYAYAVYNGLNNKSLVLSGGNNATNGANLVLYGANRTDGFQGNFLLMANDGTSSYVLKGHQSGMLSWSGNVIRPTTDNACDLGNSTYNFKNVYAYKLILKNSYIVRTANNDYLGLCGGTDYSNGAYFTLYGKDSTINSGGFRLRANDGTNSKDLIGKPDGTLTWSGDILPSADNTYNLGSSNYFFKNTYSKTMYVETLISSDNTCGIVFGSSSSDSDKQLRPRGADNNAIILGTTFARWKEIWCTQSSINSSSDERQKQQIKPIDDDLLDAWENVNPIQFKWNDAVKEKGDNARVHTGYIAQNIQQALTENGVNPNDYGLFLYDEWGEEQEEKDEQGNIIKPYRPSGNAYGLRYTETLVVECAYLRREVSKLKQQNENLEQRLKMLEQSVK